MISKIARRAVEDLARSVFKLVEDVRGFVGLIKSNVSVVASIGRPTMSVSVTFSLIEASARYLSLDIDLDTSVLG
jgi:hypothetical protein